MQDPLLDTAEPNRVTNQQSQRQGQSSSKGEEQGHEVQENPPGDEQETSNGETDTPNQWGLAVLFTALFVQWILMTILSSFFPESRVGQRISNTLQGIIFAAFPLGSTVTAPFIGPLLRKFGSAKRTVGIGLVCMLVFITLFGAVVFVLPPSIPGQPEPGWLAAPFIVLAMLYGIGSTLAEMGAYAAVTHVGLARGNAAQMVATAEIVIGIGAMLGPATGGFLYDAFKFADVSDDLQFFLPFATIAVLPAATFVVLLCTNFVGLEFAGQEPSMPAHNEKHKCRNGCFTAHHALIFAMIAFAAVTFGALSPTMEIRLDFLGVQPAHLSTISGMYMLMSSVVYILVAFPVGRLIDKGCGASGKKATCAIQPGTPLTPLSLMAIGILLNVLAAIIIGPLKLGPLDLGALDSLGGLATGLLIQGAANACIVVSSVPALLEGIADEDEAGQARMTGWFGSAFGLGLTFGPLIAGALMNLQNPFFCRAGDWPTNYSGSDATTMYPNASTADVAIHKQHCMDGLFSVLSLGGLAFAILQWSYLARRIHTSTHSLANALELSSTDNKDRSASEVFNAM